MTENDELLTFFKALADANRLKIVGLLAQQPYTVEQLAAMLGLGASTTSHHLSKLSEAGLVEAKAQSYYNVYRLKTDKMESMARRLLAVETLPTAAQGIDMDAFDHKVVNDYLLPDGHLKTIPAQHKKLQAVLRHIVASFEWGVKYPEKQVNEILVRFHADTASLRRALVGEHLMAREGGGGSYWRIKSEEKKSNEPFGNAAM